MAVKKGPIHQESLRGGSILKTGIFGNCVFATFSKNIKHLTFAGCQSEIPLNSSQLLSIPYESEVLLPICYQIFDDVLGRLSRCILQEAGILVRVSDWCNVWRVSDCEELVGAVTVGDGVGFRGISTWSIKITRKPKLFFLYRFLFSDIP
jgi:hypothetical protein